VSTVTGSIHAKRRAVVLTILAGSLTTAASCGGDAPTATKSTNTPGTPKTSPVVVTAYVDTALLFTESYFYYASRIDWIRQRQRTVARAAGAQTFRDTYPALDTLARELNDPHSFFLPPSETLGNREDPSGPLYTPTSAVIAPGIGYLWLTQFGGTNGPARADTLQRLIAQADSIAGGACGWIIDERANTGGFWPVMLAGISPLVTGGIVGGFVERDPQFKYYYYLSGASAGIQDFTGRRFEYLALSRQYELRRKNPPIALIQGRFTASAGEIIVMSFKDSTRAVRTFGGPTFGVTTQPYTYVMRDTASLLITAGLMFDRSGHSYNGAPISPDEPAVGPGVAASFTSSFRPGVRGDAAIEPAIAWLQSRPECATQIVLDRNAARRPANGWTLQATSPARPASEWPKGRPTPWVARARLK
jgi:carboxyl-terminal processing protease